MKYHALYVILNKQQISNCRLLQIIGGALRINDVGKKISSTFIIMGESFKFPKF